MAPRKPARQTLADLADGVPVGLYRTTPDGNILAANAALATLLGHPDKASLLSVNAAEFYAEPRDREAVLAELAAKGVVEDLEVRMRRRDGGLFWARFNSRAVRNARGRVVAYEGAIRDVTDRREAEQALRAAEDRYRAFVAQTTDGVARYELEVPCDPHLPLAEQVEHFYRHAYLAECNDAMARMYGLPGAAQLIGARLGDTLIRDDPNNLALLEAFIANGYRVVDAESHERGPDGRDRYFLNNFVGFLEGGKLVRAWGTQRDITGIRAAEADLRRSELLFRTIVEAAAVGIYQSLPDGTFITANQAFADLLGYDSVAEVLRLNLARDVYWDEDERTRLIERYDPQGQGTGIEVRWRRRDGSPVWIQMHARAIRDAAGRTERYEGFVHDIGARKQAEEALREQELRYRNLFERNPLPMWVYDMETLRFLAVNEAAVEHYGYSREEFLAMRLTDIRPDEEVPRLVEFVRALGPERSVSSGWRHRTRDGTVIEVEVTSHDLPFAGRPARLAAALDVTERRRAEAALLESQDRLRQAHKMEAVGRLAGGIAHDFNNLLTAILGNTALMEEDVADNPILLDGLREIRLAADRAAALTRQLLAFSRQQVLHPEVLDLNAVIERTVPMLRRLIGEDLELVTRLATALARVRADSGQVEQVLLNLVLNARDAMPRGGVLTIETADAVFDAAAAEPHPGLIPGSYATLAVSDTGQGMPPEVRARMFEPFFTTKPTGKGTGLGLATVYGIVKQSGGYIAADSEPGRGTTVRVYLPRTDAQPVPRSELHAAPASGSETVLVVEDEPAVRRLARRALEQRGFTVLEAENGAAALALAREHRGPVHLLLSDVVMPGMSGRELAEQLTAANPALAVLLMSGYTDDAVLRHGVPGGAFIQKPFTPDTLAARVRQTLDAAR